MPHRADPERL